MAERVLERLQAEDFQPFVGAPFRFGTESGALETVLAEVSVHRGQGVEGFSLLF
ncbi:MAG: hypothetical protein ABSH53_11775 [Holophaga sp.]|jgi:hypothetical protein